MGFPSFRSPIRQPGGPQIILPPSSTLPQEDFATPSPVSDGGLLLQAQIVVFGDKTKEGYLIQAVGVPWQEIIKEWKRDPEYIFRLKPRQLEELIAGAYRQSGCDDVVLTPHAGDKGRDVIVTATYPGIGQVKFIDQVKRYSPNQLVNADEVRAILGVLLRDVGVSKAIVTTTSDFAPRIFEELQEFLPTRLELKGSEELRTWLSGLIASK